MDLRGRRDASRLRRDLRPRRPAHGRRPVGVPDRADEQHRRRRRHRGPRLPDPLHHGPHRGAQVAAQGPPEHQDRGRDDERRGEPDRGHAQGGHGPDNRGPEPEGVLVRVRHGRAGRCAGRLREVPRQAVPRSPPGHDLPCGPGHAGADPRRPDRRGGGRRLRHRVVGRRRPDARVLRARSEAELRTPGPSTPGSATSIRPIIVNKDNLPPEGKYVAAETDVPSFFESKWDTEFGTGGGG